MEDKREEEIRAREEEDKEDREGERAAAVSDKKGNMRGGKERSR